MWIGKVVKMIELLFSENSPALFFFIKREDEELATTSHQMKSNFIVLPRPLVRTGDNYVSP